MEVGSSHHRVLTFSVGTRTMGRRSPLIESRTALEYFRWSEDSPD
jgi:hypothetical protein